MSSITKTKYYDITRGLDYIKSEELLNEMNKESVLQFIPNKLMWLTTSKKLDYKGRNLKTDYLIDIIHKVLSKVFLRRNRGVQLNSLTMKKLYGKYYNYYLDFLVEKNILINTAGYSVGFKSREFIINEDMLDNDYTRHINTSKFVVEKTLNDRCLKLSQDMVDVDYIKLKTKLISDLYKIKLDFEGAKEYLDNQLKNNDITDIKYQKNYLSLLDLKSNNVRYKFDEYGRFHTNFTNLKKDIRNNFLKIDNETVKEIDIKNSQPLLLSYMICSNEEYKKMIDSVELKKYNDLVLEGVFYEYMMLRWYEQFDIKIENKADMKLNIYVVLFGKQNSFSKIAKLFKAEFPTLWTFLKTIKIQKKSYKYFSHSLQRLESELLMNKIANEIDSKTTYFTVYDSVYCAESNYEKIKSIFEKHINSIKTIIKNA